MKRRTNLTDKKVGAVIHSRIEGNWEEGIEDPRVAAGVQAILLLEARGDLPDTVVFCHDLAEELEEREMKIEQRKSQ